MGHPVLCKDKNDLEEREKYHFLPAVSRFEKKISLKLILQREMEKM